MKMQIVGLLSLVAILLPWASSAQAQASSQEVAPAPTSETKEQFLLRLRTQSSVEPAIGSGNSEVKLNAAALCFTCGGPFPVFAGALPNSNLPGAVEYGSGCSGSLRQSQDRDPFLCTK